MQVKKRRMSQPVLMFVTVFGLIAWFPVTVLILDLWFDHRIVHGVLIANMLSAALISATIAAVDWRPDRSHQPRARHSGRWGRSAPRVESLPWPG